MVKLKIIAVGGIKEQYLRDACEEYVKRLTPFCNTEIIEIKECSLPDSPGTEQIKNALMIEGMRIMTAMPLRSHSIALCVGGQEISSEDIASSIQKITNTTNCICFIIGGSYGLAPEVKKICTARLSFSKLTFPHQLMRVILLEQVYRGFMINSGRTYHK